MHSWHLYQHAHRRHLFRLCATILCSLLGGRRHPSSLWRIGEVTRYAIADLTELHLHWHSLLHQGSGLPLDGLPPGEPSKPQIPHQDPLFRFLYPYLTSCSRPRCCSLRTLTWSVYRCLSCGHRPSKAVRKPLLLLLLSQNLSLSPELLQIPYIIVVL